MDDLRISFNPQTEVWELIEFETGDVLDNDTSLDALTINYPKALVLLPVGV